MDKITSIHRTLDSKAVRSIKPSLSTCAMWDLELLVTMMEVNCIKTFQETENVHRPFFPLYVDRVRGDSWHVYSIWQATFPGH